jgi:hypothetical protein
MVRIVALALALAPLSSTANLKISAWYWLNSAPRAEWSRDFQSMGKMGFTDVALCWGLDAAAWTLRTEDTNYALDSARRAGIGAYFIVWHPVHNSLPRKPEFQQVDPAGNLRFAFDTFNPQWRRTQWKQYLQSVARLYGRHPAFAGYILDDTFGIGPIGDIGGPSGKPETRYISYGPADKKLYGKEPPHSPAEPGWDAWTKARAGWLVDWASDTMRFLREIDADPKHEIYVEDSVGAIFGSGLRDRAGVDFGKVAQPWDAIGAYGVARWDGKPGSSERAAAETRDSLAKVRSAVGSGKRIIYTFWVANILELNNAAAAQHPTFEEIRAICEAALAAGIRHLDMYGYRIGDYVVNADTWPKKRPPASGPYPITGQYPHKFLYDRPELRQQLTTYLRSLATR